MVSSIQAFEPEAFVIFFLLGFLFSASRKGLVWPLIAGIFFGLGLLTRANFLPVLVVVPFYYFWHEQARWKKAAVSVLLFLLPVTGSLLFLGYNSRAVLGYPMISMNPGTVFYEGEQPDILRTGGDVPPARHRVCAPVPGRPDYQHVAYRLFARGAVDPALTIPEVNAYWAGKGTNFLRDHPGLAVKRLFRKLFLSLHGFDWHDLVTTYWNQKKLRRGWMPGFPFGVISALALLGLIVCRRAWAAPPAHRRRASLTGIDDVGGLRFDAPEGRRNRVVHHPGLRGGLTFIWENRQKIWPLLLPVPLALGLSIRPIS